MTGRPDDGTVPAERWAQTEVAQASTINCGWCGLRFATAQDFYAHVDAVHPKTKTKTKDKR